MKKILTAINNPNLNKKLKEEKYLKVINKDIQYKEGILEILNIIEKIDIIIINEKLPGKINIIELLKKIKNKNNKIKIILISENKNIKKQINNFNIKNIDIYFNNEININDLIKLINKKEINKEEELKKEIEELKKIISGNKYRKEKKKTIVIKKLDKAELKIRVKIKDLQKIIKKSNIYKSIHKTTNKQLQNKVITITGDKKVGKSLMTLLISKHLIKDGKRIVLLEFSDSKTKLMNILNIKSNINKSKRVKIVEEENINCNFKKINDKLYISSNIIKQISNKKQLDILMEKVKKEFDLIIIEIENNHKLEKEILINSDYNLLITESNILTIKNTKEILNKYIFKYKINKNKIRILINKNKIKNINKKIIFNILNKNKIIGKINYKKYYNNLIQNKINANKKIKEIKTENKIQKIINGIIIN